MYSEPTLLEAWQFLSPCVGGWFPPEVLLPSTLQAGGWIGVRDVSCCLESHHPSWGLCCALETCPTLLCSCPCTRSVGHTHRRVTEHLKVPYYVSESFAEEYTGTNLKNVERSVEDDYIANLRNNCWREKQQSE